MNVAALTKARIAVGVGVGLGSSVLMADIARTEGGTPSDFLKSRAVPLGVVGIGGVVGSARASASFVEKVPRGQGANLALLGAAVLGLCAGTVIGGIAGSQ